MNKVLSIIAVLVLGGVLGAGGYAWFGAGPASDGDAQNEGKGEPPVLGSAHGRQLQAR